MEERRRCTTVRQLELLVEFMEAHSELALGKVRSKEGRAIAARLWAECSELLNPEGPARTGKEWAKVWNDQKCKVRAKIMNINGSLQATGGGPSTAASLSVFEDRVANIIGRNVGPLLNVRQNQFATQNEENNSNPVLENQDARQTPPIELVIVDNEGGPLMEVPFPELPLPVSPTPSEQEHVLNPPNRVIRNRERRRIERVSRQNTARNTAAPQTSRTALEESRSMILQIERLRAEAAANNAAAMQSFAGSMRLIAESIDRLSQKFCQQSGD